MLYIFVVIAVVLVGFGLRICNVLWLIVEYCILLIASSHLLRLCLHWCIVMLCAVWAWWIRSIFLILCHLPLLCVERSGSACSLTSEKGVGGYGRTQTTSCGLSHCHWCDGFHDWINNTGEASGEKLKLPWSVESDQRSGKMVPVQHSFNNRVVVLLTVVWLWVWPLRGDGLFSSMRVQKNSHIPANSLLIPREYRVLS